MHLWVLEDPDYKDWDYTQFSKRVHIDWDPQQNEDREGEAKVFELRFLVSILTSAVGNMEIPTIYGNSHARLIASPCTIARRKSRLMARWTRLKGMLLPIYGKNIQQRTSGKCRCCFSCIPLSLITHYYFL
jgi:hypothetical protein